jgi:hypothetical protein
MLGLAMEGGIMKMSLLLLLLLFLVLGFALSQGWNRWKRRVPKGQHLFKLKLSDIAFDQIKALATQRRSSITECLRLALGLFKIAVDAKEQNQKIIIVTPEGRSLREIVLPDVKQASSTTPTDPDRPIRQEALSEERSTPSDTQPNEGKEIVRGMQVEFAG